MDKNIDNCPMVIKDFVKDFETYLSLKLPDVPIDTRAEIAAFVGYNSCILITDIVDRVNREWKNSLRRKY